ncbi:protein MALE DISCOVERER 2-like [Chenopodium quinoa]|uniref:protein MALE DISCOVERER 2-like n=1 Tax=Chenopodium quinoa TaxID=63459 RepID=UPI000B792EFD|nr:protein MALE DISCOVERER 2-like [Chenopodium quinoa]
MVKRWNSYEIQLSCIMVLAILAKIQKCESLNLEGLALLEFRERIENDPYGAFANWNPNHSEPCAWLGVQCLNGKVKMLDLSGLSLQGTLTPTLNKLRYMQSLVMSNNSFSGFIPREIGELKLLEVLDLKHNNFSGNIPLEIGGMSSIKCMSFCGNNLLRDNPPTIGILDYLFESSCNQQISSNGFRFEHYVKRNISCNWWRILNQLRTYFGFISMLETKNMKCCFYDRGNNCCCNESSAIEDSYRRHLVEQSSNNLVVVRTKVVKDQQKNSPIVLSTGAYPVHLQKPTILAQSSSSTTFTSTTSHEHSKPNKFFLTTTFIILVVSVVATLSFCFALIAIKRYCSAKVVQAQNASLLHRLSKVFVTGVPVLNSSELQTACEDFSNIIDTFSGCLMYKGILSTGVEIAVLSTSIRSSQQWSNYAEREFKRKMDTFSKINHKNFINLLGHCEEDNPFVRMMVFEYAPNGNLYEHLHVKDIDHLDWTTRMRIIMGTCYCLEYMHHELNPPVVHPNLQSDTILLTDDYAAKVADISFWADIVSKAKISDDEELEPLHSNPGPTCEDNVYNLGILLLEIISTKSLNAQAIEYLKDKKKYCNLVDPSLKSFKNNELEIICEVIHECLNEDPRRRPTLKDVTSKLQEVIKITPEAASARHSPLWWAELEILSIESG